jgi:hypothetical protein
MFCCRYAFMHRQVPLLWNPSPATAAAASAKLLLPAMILVGAPPSQTLELELSARVTGKVR